MAVSSTANPCSPLGLSGPPSGGLLRSLLGPHLARRLDVLTARKRLKSELERLDHRELRDLGLDSSGIDGYVAFWAPPWRN